MGSWGYLGETQHVRIYHTGETLVSGQPTIYIYGHEALAGVKLLFVRVIQYCLCGSELTDNYRACPAISIIRQMSRFSYPGTEALLRVIPISMNFPKAIEVELS